MTEQSVTWDSDYDADDIGPRHYVNHIDLAFSLSEVLINLGQNFRTDGGVLQQCRLVTSPVHLQHMEAVLSRTLQDYKDRFGNIIQPTPADMDLGNVTDKPADSQNG